MVRSCAAANCTNRFEKGTGITFYKFPLYNEQLLLQWLNGIGRDGFKPTNNHFICSNHFEDACFLKGYVHCRKLIDGAVPTKFDRWKPRKGSRAPRKVSRVERCPSPFVEAIPFVEAVYDEDAVTNSIQHAIDLDHNVGSKPTTTETLLAQEREKNVVLTRKLKHSRAMSRQHLKLICELTESLSDLKKQIEKDKSGP